MHDLQKYALICKAAMARDEDWYPDFLAYTSFVTGASPRTINTNIMRVASGQLPLQRKENEDSDT